MTITTDINSAIGFIVDNVGRILITYGSTSGYLSTNLYFTGERDIL